MKNPTIASFKRNILLCLGLIFFVPFLILYLAVYDLKTWRLWHGVKCVTFYNGVITVEDF